jgi:hypothetical protein
MAPSGHAAKQSPQCRHRSTEYITDGRKLWLSGLWHHQQASGHPLKKTVVLIPGPSCVENRMTLKIIAVSLAVSLDKSGLIILIYSIRRVG